MHSYLMYKENYATGAIGILQSRESVVRSSLLGEVET